MKSNQVFNFGYASVTLVIFTAMALVITTAAVTMSISSLSTLSEDLNSQVAFGLSQSGIENALLRLLRDPTYVGETITSSQGTILVSVTGTNPQTIVSVGRTASHQRTIEVIVDRSSGILDVISWSEIYE